VAPLDILEVVCYAKKYRDLIEHNVQLFKSNTLRELDLHVHLFNTSLLRKHVVNSGIRLHSKILPDNKKVGQAQIFQQGAEILSVTCTLLRGKIYGIMTVYGLLECMSWIGCNANLF